MKKKYSMFIDMDGVLVDFNKGYLELTGKDISGQFFDDEKFWDPINKAGYDFWFNLDWLPDGKELWSYVKKYNPKILSAPSREIESSLAKQDWVKKELPGTKVILKYAKHKKDCATPNSILIDDRLNNVEDWIRHGGIGIHHTSTKSTINQLKKMGL